MLWTCGEPPPPRLFPVWFRSHGGAGGWGLGERQEGVRDSVLGLCTPWLPLSCPANAFSSLFVCSGPRLHPRQKESRKPTKVSPHVLGSDPSPCLEGAWISPTLPFQTRGWGGAQEYEDQDFMDTVGLTLAFLKAVFP